MMTTTIVFFTSVLSFCIVLALVKIFRDQWWVPYRLRCSMSSQGIRGPTYRFIHGSTKEIAEMRREAASKPLGLSHDLVPVILPHVHRWTKSYGKIHIQWLGPTGHLVITNPELIKEILNNRENLFPKMKLLSLVRNIFGEGLGASEGEKWVKMRKLANHVFQGESLKVMVPLMVESVEAMVERWKGREGEEIEVFGEFRLLTSEVISRTAFGSSYLQGKVIFNMLEDLTLIASRNLMKQRFPVVSKIFKSTDEIESEKIEKRIRNSIKELIRKREEKVTNGEDDDFGSDFLGELLKAHHDSRGISVDEMVDECKTFYFAGQETTNSLLSWTVFLLALYPDWQEEARKEVLGLFGRQSMKADGLSKLKCMTMIINESLRLYTPAISLIRRVDSEARLGDLDLPAGTVLSIPILAVHHDPEIWGDDVHLFNPRRFSEGIAKATNDNFGAFLPFGMGPRICVGFNFAITEAKIALAMILQRYSFRLSPAYIHSPTQVLTIRPQHGLQLILNRC